MKMDDLGVPPFLETTNYFHQRTAKWAKNVTSLSDLITPTFTGFLLIKAAKEPKSD